MIIWLNGTFGVGKTTTAHELLTLLPDARLFDTEEVGQMLRTIPGLPTVSDFQQWPPWRGLVVETARQVLDYVGGTLVVPQSVQMEQYWTEISDGLAWLHTAGQVVDTTSAAPGEVARSIASCARLGI